MRKRLTIATAALLLASATVAMAQTEQKTTPPPAAAQTATEAAPPSLGTIDFGLRATSTTGDRARYERYRDLRNGANVNLVLEKVTDRYRYDVKGTNIGYKDQNLSANFVNKRVKLNAFFDQTPLNYGLDGMTKTPWIEASKSVWTLPDAAQGAVENKTAVGVLCSPGLAAGATCNATAAALALSQVSIYRGLAQDFDLKSRRDVMGVGVVFAATRDVDVDVSFKTTGRTGYQPFGMSFSFGNANELPRALDDRNNEFGVGLKWGSDQSTIRVAYERSMFNQNIPSVTWDNPIRLTNWNDGGAIVGADGPWDPSAYSNGNGAAMGRISTSPSNTLDLFSVTASARMPSHSSLNASLALTTSAQDDALIPWTINPVIANAATYAAYPGLAQLPRNTAEAKFERINATLNFNTRPTDWVGLTARYRYYDSKDRMPQFNGNGNTVRFDGVPEAAGPYMTEPFDSTRNTFNVDATFTPVPYTALKVGMGQDKLERTSRAFAGLTDTSVRASLDTVGNQYIQLRGIVERIRRVGTGFNEEAIVGPGGQERSRMFDDAERTRDRRTLLVTITPIAALDFTASYGKGEDQYDGAEQEFGLLDNENTSTNVGVNVTPSDKVAFGVNYGQDKFNSFQRSRTANPFSGVAGAYESWVDTNRDWTLTNDEKVNNFDLYLDLIKSLPKTDIRFAFNYSDSDNAFVHGGPRIQAMKTNAILTKGDAAPCSGVSSCFEALPNVTNTWQRGTVDLRHYFTERIGLGVEYWYEKLEISDYATINIPGTDTPRIDYLGELSTGYGNRPYTGSTGFVRLIVNF